jgi:hypothetical protein
MIILKSKNLIVVYNPLMDGNLADYISWKGWKIFNGEQEITTIEEAEELQKTIKP